MENVAKNFGQTKALDGLSFEVCAGEIFGFLGPSGAGKTTTIKLLTRQLEPTSGKICVFFSPVRELAREDDDRIGVLSDNSGAYDRLSVWDNMSLFAQLRKTEKGGIDETLKDVGLYDEKNKQVKHLSRGMKQRLLLAQAILHKPMLLFLDEPTASLDPATSADIHRLLQRLNKNGTTIFLTTHNMDEADKLCHRVAFLNGGQIAEIGTPRELKIKYSSGRIEAVLEDGTKITEEKNAKGLLKIAEAAKAKGLESVHSIEPNLEEIFLEVTGRGLT